MILGYDVTVLLYFTYQTSENFGCCMSFLPTYLPEKQIFVLVYMVFINCSGFSSGLQFEV